MVRIQAMEPLCANLSVVLVCRVYFVYMALGKEVLTNVVFNNIRATTYSRYVEQNVNNDSLGNTNGGNPGVNTRYA